MVDIDANDVEVKPNGTVNSGTMTYEVHKLGSMYIVYVKSSIRWEEGGNSWKFTIKGRAATGTWISGKALTSISAGIVSGNPGSGIAILYQ